MIPHILEYAVICSDRMQTRMYASSQGCVRTRAQCCICMVSQMVFVPGKVVIVDSALCGRFDSSAEWWSAVPAVCVCTVDRELPREQTSEGI